MSTRYVILEAVDHELFDGAGDVVDTITAWLPVRDDDGALRVIEATGQAGALNRLEEGLPEDAVGTWKAVPLRSWTGGRSLQPQTRRTRLAFED
jgi:hypothetical protein